ncbi:MAG TPA: hypothetical protein VNE62_12395 [Actinomycetota bacterium]|nr:hypothetical protein [Actinomycetota bacterium]
MGRSRAVAAVAVAAALCVSCSEGPRDTLGPRGTAPGAAKASIVAVPAAQDFFAKPLPGLQYQELPPALGFSVNAFCDTARGTVVTDCAAKWVTRGGQGMAMVLVTVNAKARPDDPAATEDRLVLGAREELARDAKSPPQVVQVAGRKVVYAEAVGPSDSPLLYTMAWPKSAQVSVQVRGSERARVEPVMTAFIQVNGAS